MVVDVQEVWGERTPKEIVTAETWEEAALIAVELMMEKESGKVGWDDMHGIDVAMMHMTFEMAEVLLGRGFKVEDVVRVVAEMASRYK